MNGLFPIMSLEDTIIFLKQIQANYTRIDGGTLMGINIEVVETQWYNQTLTYDIVTNLLQLLMRHGLSTKWTSTQNKIPVIISSAEQSTLLRIATLTDLPLL